MGWLVWVVRPFGPVGPLVNGPLVGAVVPRGPLIEVAVSPHNTSPVGIFFVGLCVIPYFIFSIAEVGLVF